VALSAALKSKALPMQLDISIVKGDTAYYLGIITVDDAVQDLTGCTVTAKIKTADNGSDLLVFTCSVPTPLSGQVLIQATPAQTGGLTIASDGAQIGVWAAEVTDGTDVVTFVRGKVTGYTNRVS
jgi:hypothetical protein